MKLGEFLAKNDVKCFKKIYKKSKNKVLKLINFIFKNKKM